jgi:hypothetical protein
MTHIPWQGFLWNDLYPVLISALCAPLYAQIAMGCRPLLDDVWKRNRPIIVSCIRQPFLSKVWEREFFESDVRRQVLHVARLEWNLTLSGKCMPVVE